MNRRIKKKIKKRKQLEEQYMQLKWHRAYCTFRLRKRYLFALSQSENLVGSFDEYLRFKRRTNSDVRSRIMSIIQSARRPSPMPRLMGAVYIDEKD